MLFLKRGMIIVIGSTLLAFGINGFLIPFKVLDGGVIGLGLILKYLWEIRPGLAIIFLSIPIYILAWFKYRPYFYNSLHGMFISSFFIDLFHPLQHSFIPLDPPLSSIIGGIFVGSGIGLMLRFKTSTGGLDLIAQFLSEMTRINVGILIFMIDTIIVSIGGWLLSSDTFLLSILTIFSVGLTTSLVTWQVKER